MYNGCMRIILTHEQADFDALACLLGAQLIDEAALPVLQVPPVELTALVQNRLRHHGYPASAWYRRYLQLLL